MSDFKTQIENLAGKTTFNSNAGLAIYKDMLNNFLKQSARNVLDVVDEKYLVKDSHVLEVADENGFGVSIYKIVKILRNGEGCVEFPLEMKAKVATNSTSIYAPSKKSPVYYIEGQASSGAKLFIKPDPTGTEKGQIYFNVLPAPVHTDTAISNFPDEAEYAVVLGAAVKVLQFKLNKILHEDEDVELGQVLQGEMQVVNSIYMSEISRLSGMPMQQAEGES